MKLPNYLKLEGLKLKPFTDYMRNQVTMAGEAPQPKFFPLVVQFASLMQPEFEKGIIDPDTKTIVAQSLVFTAKVEKYLQSIGKIPSDTAVGAAAPAIITALGGLFNPPQQPQPVIVQAPQKKDYTEVILIGGVALLAVVLLIK